MELVRKVRSERMTLPIILATSTLPEADLEPHPWPELAATLVKPFSPDQLLETVKQVLRADDCASSVRQSSLSLLADTCRQMSPYEHWGINE